VAVFSVKLAVDDEERSQRYQSTFQSKVPSLALRLIEAGNKTTSGLDFVRRHRQNQKADRKKGTPLQVRTVPPQRNAQQA
jgi:hypothetical protein